MLSQRPSLMICNESMPFLASMLAKLLRNVWGLQGKPVLLLKSLSTSPISHFPIPQMLPQLGLYRGSHCLSSASVFSPKGARPSLLPLHRTLTRRLSQSMFSSLTEANSLSRSPESLKREIMALSLTDSHLSISETICSGVSDGSMRFPTLGGSTISMGLCWGFRA